MRSCAPRLSMAAAECRWHRPSADHTDRVSVAISDPSAGCRSLEDRPTAGDVARARRPERWGSCAGEFEGRVGRAVRGRRYRRGIYSYIILLPGSITVPSVDTERRRRGERFTWERKPTADGADVVGRRGAAVEQVSRGRTWRRRQGGLRGGFTNGTQGDGAEPGGSYRPRQQKILVTSVASSWKLTCGSRPSGPEPANQVGLEEGI